MKLPEVKNADKYRGLYVVDFGDHCGVGFTAEEVAELLESERFCDVQAYKIHRATPDGTMELAGVNKETFQLEAGMFFYAQNPDTAKDDFQRLNAWADQQHPPARCKVHLAGHDDTCVTALIYPAEYDDAFSRWLLDANYFTTGLVESGTGAACGYYNTDWDILDQKQHWPASSVEHLRGEALMEAANRAIVR